MIDADHGFGVGICARRGGFGLAGHAFFARKSAPSAAAPSEKMAL
jgi:hypothetical protein